MEEITRVFALKITFIEQVKPEDIVADKNKAAENLCRVLDMCLDCDDIVVEQVQDFVMDK